MIADSTIQELHLNANPAANTESNNGGLLIEKILFTLQAAACK